jgi:hypothetical protein
MNVIGSQWVYKIKLRVDGNIERYKALLVARGFTQQEGIDYFEMFNPFIKQATIILVFFFLLWFLVIGRSINLIFIIFFLMVFLPKRFT